MNRHRSPPESLEDLLKETHDYFSTKWKLCKSITVTRRDLALMLLDPSLEKDLRESLRGTLLDTFTFDLGVQLYSLDKHGLQDPSEDECVGCAAMIGRALSAAKSIHYLATKSAPLAVATAILAQSPNVEHLRMVSRPVALWKLSTIEMPFCKQCNHGIASKF